MTWESHCWAPSASERLLQTCKLFWHSPSWRPPAALSPPGTHPCPPCLWVASGMFQQTEWNLLRKKRKTTSWEKLKKIKADGFGEAETMRGIWSQGFLLGKEHLKASLQIPSENLARISTGLHWWAPFTAPSDLTTHPLTQPIFSGSNLLVTLGTSWL